MRASPVEPSFSPALEMSMKRQKRILKDELPRSVGAQYATGDQWRGSRKNEETELSFRDVNVWKSRPEKGEGIFG